jgi:putative FmdB family regulatory protein
MPVYDFSCKNKKCGAKYDALAKHDPTGKYPSVRCPKCNSTHKEKQEISTFAFTGSTDVYNGSHDYRFMSNLPKAMDQRERAQKKAEDPTGYVGKKPYRDIDDISSGKNFGPVK